MSIIIGNGEIFLGEILDLAAEKFKSHEKLPSYGGWPNYRFAGTSCKKVLVCIVFQLIRFFNLISRLFIPHLRKRGILTFYWILNEEEDW